MWADLLLDAAASYRLTRLVVEDTFPPVKALRDRIVEAHTERRPVYGQGEHPGEVSVIGFQDEVDSLGELVTCPWCAGMWIALGVVAARAVAPKAWAPLAKALAFSLGSGLLATKVDT